MDSMRICGSCHTLVQVDDNQGGVRCPRCKDPLDPSPRDTLRKFIETGIVETNRRGGTTLREAQEAADAILGALMHEEIKLRLHHLDGKCSDCVLALDNREEEA